MSGDIVPDLDYAWYVCRMHRKHSSSNRLENVRETQYSLEARRKPSTVLNIPETEGKVY